MEEGEGSVQAGVLWETRVTQTRTQDIVYLRVIVLQLCVKEDLGGRENWGHSSAVDMLCDLIKGHPLSGPQLSFL